VISIRSLIILLSLVASAAAQDKWTLVTADFQSQPANVAAMDEKGVRLAGSGGGAQSVSWDQLLELDHAAASSAASTPAKFILHLNGGDTLSGSPLSIAGDTVTWNHPLLGKLEIPEDRVSAILLAGQSAAGLDQPRKTDSVRLTNGDATSGVIDQMTDSMVSIHPEGADASVQISLDKVAAILLADSDPMAASTGGWRLWLADGSSLTVGLVRIAAQDVSHVIIGYTPQKTVTIDASAVSCIEQTTGPVRWLTSLTPAEIVYHPFLGENFPPRFDHPLGDPDASIRQAFPPFRHGISVHSYTKLTYAIPDGYTGFRTQFEIPAVAGAEMARADVAARILVDGAPAAQFPHVRFGKPADAVVLDITGKKQISLEVDFGDNYSALGRLVWLDPAFVRTAPAK